MTTWKRLLMATLAGIVSFATIVTAAVVDNGAQDSDKVPWAVVATAASTLLAAALLRWGAKMDRTMDKLNERLEAQDKTLTKLLTEHEVYACKLKEHGGE